LDAFDAVFVGTPEALSASDVDGLDAYARRRGGSVVLLLDQRTSGPYDRLIGTTTWAHADESETIVPDWDDSLRAREVAWPSELPPGARSLAVSHAVRAGSSGRPIVWTSALGKGRVIVSGALDAWTARDSTISAFAPFWRTLAARAASAAPAAIDIQAPSTLLPGERGIVTVRVRADETELPRVAESAASASLDVEGRSEQVVLAPTADAGVFRGTVVAPRTPTLARLTVSARGLTASRALSVRANGTGAHPTDASLTEAWITAHGGLLYSPARLAELAAAIAARSPRAERVTHHPMRSAWWIIPFALLLAIEWRAERRNASAFARA
ncbi:MAG TPA: hypothetical protein VE967_09075, partial [Gemmatimonadaceae bacterium]|nr:hypothetical protein [Gemmatimonadaceae bacterium]